MHKFIAVAVVSSLAIAASIGEGAAQTSLRLPDTAATLTTKISLGCSINWRRFLFLRNTTATTIKVGTPIYWNAKQVGQQQREYVAPIYQNLAPGGTYQIGGVYKYERSTGCQVWILGPPLATQAQ